MTAFSPVLTPAPNTGMGVKANHHASQTVPTSATVTSEHRIPNSSSIQNKQLSLPRSQLGHEHWRMRRVGDPASRSWSPRPAIGNWRFWPGRCFVGAAVRKDLNLASPPSTRTSAVARCANDFRNCFRVEASGSIGPMCLLSGAVTCARPSSAMSPAGYSLALLSSNRLRFADRLPWWGSFRLGSTEKMRACLSLAQRGRSGPPGGAATAGVKTGENAVVLNRC